ncbi:MAG: vitamin K epoxide reductase family protein [Chlorogloea purpurea SAG 13.99]|nr:vitamin K epoxide reductase family protein [Chlorogloea purpurea SAG 13.99]
MRRRSQPWIHRYSRLLIGAIAVVGLIISTYLTIVEWSGGQAACPIDPTTGVSGCQKVAESPYSHLFGVPLSLLGMFGYLGIIVLALAPLVFNAEQDKKTRNQIDQSTWLLLLIGTTAMAVFSAYLIFTSTTVIKALCVYCLASAICSWLLFIMTIFGRQWEEIGQLIFTCLVVGVITLVAALGLYSGANNAIASSGKTDIPLPTVAAAPPYGWEVSTTSGPAEIALAKHLASKGIKEYGAFWCPHCYEQKQLFGKEAVAIIKEEKVYVECDPQGNAPDPKACSAAGIKGFPTWIIAGAQHSGTQSLEKLAELSGYQGPMDFKYKLPGR